MANSRGSQLKEGSLWAIRARFSRLLAPLAEDRGHKGLRVGMRPRWQLMAMGRLFEIVGICRISSSISKYLSKLEKMRKKKARRPRSRILNTQFQIGPRTLVGPSVCQPAKRGPYKVAREVQRVAGRQEAPITISMIHTAQTELWDSRTAQMPCLATSVGRAQFLVHQRQLGRAWGAHRDQSQ